MIRLAQRISGVIIELLHSRAEIFLITTWELLRQFIGATVSLAVLRSW